MALNNKNMALVGYDDSGSDDNQETEDYNRPAVVSKTVKIGLPFNNLVSSRKSSSNGSCPIFLVVVKLKQMWCSCELNELKCCKLCSNMRGGCW